MNKCFLNILQTKVQLPELGVEESDDIKVCYVVDWNAII